MRTPFSAKRRHDVQVAAVTAGHGSHLRVEKVQTIHQGVVVSTHHDGTLEMPQLAMLTAQSLPCGNGPQKGDRGHCAPRSPAWERYCHSCWGMIPNALVFCLSILPHPSDGFKHFCAPPWICSASCRWSDWCQRGQLRPRRRPCTCAHNNVLIARMQRLTTAPALTTTPSISNFGVLNGSALFQ